MNKTMLAVMAVLGAFPMLASAQAVDVSGATTAIGAAATAGGLVITAGLAFAGIWVGYKYAKRIFGKA
jgi:hypothetical protein